MALDPAGGSAYNGNIYTVGAKGSRVILENDNGIFPGSMPSHYVWNIGRTPIHAEVVYGTKFGWIGTVTDSTFKPGEYSELTNYGKSYYVLGLRLHNYTDVRGLVHASSAPYGRFSQFGGDKGSIDINYHNLMKQMVVFGSKFIPTIGSSLSGLVNAFWPENKPSAWEQVQQQVQKLLNDKIQQTINGILDGDIRYYKERIQVFLTQLESKSENVASNYMNIAQDLVGFERKFSFSHDQPDYQKINYHLLPLFSTMVTLKMGFYGRGIAQATEIGLKESDVSDIKAFATRLIHDTNGAINYIIDMHRERLTNAYTTAYAEDVYNVMMDVRSYVAVHGLEYIPKWKAMLEDPTSDGKVYNDVISYSHFYGSQSPELYNMAIPEEVRVPLLPKLVEGKRNRMKSLTVYRMYDVDKIAGLNLVFENGDTHMMGKSDGRKEEIDFKGAYLTKLVAKGRGALDRLIFTFSDGREVSVGMDSIYWTAFELENHHIASIYLSSGANSLANQAANIAVAYHRNDTIL